MTLEFYAVKDETANRFMTPSLIMSENEAKRAFKSQVNNIQIWKDNPEDFSLYKLGNFDEETGTIIGIKPEKIVGGRSVVNG